MTVAKAISLLLFLVALSGCASQLQQPNTSQIAEKEGEQQQQKSQMPTITYRPGG